MKTWPEIEAVHEGNKIIYTSYVSDQSRTARAIVTFDAMVVSFESASEQGEPMARESIQQLINES